MCDDERRLLQECRGMSDDERKAFSSKGPTVVDAVLDPTAYRQQLKSLRG